MDPTLIGNFIRFPTTKQVWDSAATTYFDGGDTSQVYDLRRCVSCLCQAGGSLEKYYTDLQGLWREIDFQRPNPMEFPADIQRYNNLLQEDRVYVFLDGLDDKLDNNQSDVTMNPLQEQCLLREASSLGSMDRTHNMLENLALKADHHLTV
ncbi:hypothetical protein CISIN_1g045161mg [Citrus sinensis]|uniref:Retrotransposon gag domain-containing protein n=1 Tax=Citrus sinensis TaxID=2711 RepID=A0A067DDX9_CITSI|nr:hypothetical protein CISIN_1g045161mg [Citrus sinensis]